MEDKNKDILKNSNIPDQFQWEMMEDKIIHKMNELEKGKKKRRIFFILFFFGALGILLWLLMPESNQRTVSQISDTSSLDNTPLLAEGKPSSQIDLDTSQDEVPASNQSKESRHIDTQNRIIKANEVVVSEDNKAITNEEIADKKSESIPIFHENQITNTSIENNSSTIKSTENTYEQIEGADLISNALSKMEIQEETENNSIYSKFKSEIGNQISTDSFTDVFTKEMPSIETKTFMELAAIDRLPVSWLHFDKERIAIPFSPRVNLSNTKMKSHQISMTGGLSIWNPGYGTLAPERDVYEKAIPSFGSQLSYAYRFSKGWTIMTGIHFQKLESKFYYTKQINDYKLTLQDTIILIQTNAISGQQNFIRGDVDVLVDAQLSIQHFNSTDLYQAPLLFGYTRAIGPMEYMIGGGPSFNLWTQHNGRTIVGNEIMTYGKARNTILSTHFGINALVYGTASYQIYQDWSIIASCGFQKSINNWSLEPNTSIQPVIMNLGLGLSYKFQYKI